MKTIRKFISIVLTLVMLIGVFSAVPLSAAAETGSIPYVERSWKESSNTVVWHGEFCTDYTDLKHRSSNTLSAGWYVVKDSFTITERLYIGDYTVNILLCDGATLTANDGIGLSRGGTLNIYGQADDSGKIFAHYEKGPETEDINKGVIGADSGDTGTIRIYGGSLDVETGHTINCYYGAAIGGGKGGSPKKIEIYGGNVTCRTHGYGAAIGGGYGGKTSWDQSGGTGTAAGIVIYGGNITANGYEGSAIGSGSNCSGRDNSAIAIFDGDIDAVESATAAGIGGGEYSSNGPIDIYGGRINASGVNSRYTGAGIGGGREANQTSPIRIHGGTIVATGGSGAGIGAGYKGKAGAITISGASVVASSTAGGAGIGGGKCDSNTGGYGGNITISDSTVVATSSEYEEAQAFKDTLNRCIGNSKMKTDATAFADSAVSMIALLVDLFDDNNSGTGIGGGTGGDAGTITLINSDITAESGKYAAAIGSGEEGKVDTINISNCTVRATSGRYAAAIGSGDESDSGCTINITNGSEVVATAGTDAAGIGTGNDTDGTATINITDSDVTAHGGNYGAGIGGGDDTDGGNITIDNSTVTADSQTDAAGIGGGESGAGGTILITNSSNVVATGGGYGAGIGGGDNGNGGSITISDYSTVTANGGTDAAGIGGGEDGDGGTVKIYNSVAYATGNSYGAGIGCGEDGSSAAIEIYGESTVEAIAGNSGYSTALGNGDYVMSAPSVSVYIDNGLVVHAGSSASNTQRYTGIYRYGGVWNNKYANIHPCEHPNAKWSYFNSSSHIQKCTECDSTFGNAQAHNWNAENVCTVCGSAAVMCTLTLVEKDSDGTEVITEIEAPKYTEYALPACTHAPAGMEFIAWEDDGIYHQPGNYIEITSIRLEAVYLPVTEVSFVDSKGTQRTVQARRMSERVSYLSAGWYVADENIDYSHYGATLLIDGSVNLILADGATVNLNNSGGNSLMATGTLSCLSLYGQSGQSGRFSCEHGNLRLADFCQYGGNVDIDGSVSTLTATIARGSMQTKSLSASSGFYITGGTVDVGSSTTAVANTIGWTDMTDSIRFDTLKRVGENAGVSVAEGEAFTDGTNVYSGTLSAEQIAALQGQTLVPYTLHHFGAPEWNWSEDYEHASATFHCVDDGCDYSKTLKAVVIKSNEQVPTCTATGSVAWEAGVEFEGTSYTDNQTKVIPKLTDMTRHPRVEPTKTTEGNIEYYTCNRCGKYFTYDADTREYTEIDPAQTVIAKLPASNGYSLTLDDTIQINFLIDAATYGAQDGYLVYEYVKTTQEETAERVDSEEIAIESLDVHSGDDIYNTDVILTLCAAPAQIAQEYIIRIYNKSGELKGTLTASVADYCERMQEDATYGELMRALLNYGQLANEYFSYAALVEGDYEVPHTEDYLADLSAEETAALDEAVISRLHAQGAAQIKGISYIAQINPEFKFYFKNATSLNGAVSDNLNAVTETEGSYTVVRVSGLKASEFAKTFTVSLDGTEIEYNGYAYIKTALKNANTKALARGVFRYAQAAEKAFS